MATAPLRACRFPGCPTLGPCELHPMRRLFEPWRKWFYTARWRYLRKAVLDADPLCVSCRLELRAEPATEVDHIEPHRGDARLFWMRSNLQGLCSTHHAEKTRRGL
jgi:5-methylcytosine-specific restriction enzyme A